MLLPVVLVLQKEQMTSDQDPLGPISSMRLLISLKLFKVLLFFLAESGLENSMLSI